MVCKKTNPDDTDTDGMPDGYEVANSLNPLVDDSNGDADGDGLTNIQEFTKGKNPNLKDNIMYVDFTYTGPESGTQTEPFNTLAEAINAIAAGGEIIINGGTTSETFEGSNKINKKVTIKSSGGTVVIGKQ